VPAHEHLKGEQLSMFMPAHKLMAYPSAEYWDDADDKRFSGSFGGDKELVAMKRHENTKSTSFTKHDGEFREEEALGPNVAREGVHKPVMLGVDRYSRSKVIWNGHHRTLAAFDANPNMEVPVTHGYTTYEKT